jgi:hypothetical protein
VLHAGEDRSSSSADGTAEPQHKRLSLSPLQPYMTQQCKPAACVGHSHTRLCCMQVKTEAWQTEPQSRKTHVSFSPHCDRRIDEERIGLTQLWKPAARVSHSDTSTVVSNIFCVFTQSRKFLRKPILRSCNSSESEEFFFPLMFRVVSNGRQTLPRMTHFSVVFSQNRPHDESLLLFEFFFVRKSGSVTLCRRTRSTQ